LFLLGLRTWDGQDLLRGRLASILLLWGSTATPAFAKSRQSAWG